MTNMNNKTWEAFSVDNPIYLQIDYKYLNDYTMSSILLFAFIKCFFLFTLYTFWSDTQPLMSTTPQMGNVFSSILKVDKQTYLSVLNMHN